MNGVHLRAALTAMTVVGCMFEPSKSRFGNGETGTFGAGGTPFVTSITGGSGANGFGAGGFGANGFGFGAGGFVGTIPTLPDVGAPCEPSRTVDSNGPALLVKDPEVLARFGLERVLRQIIDTAKGAAPTTPTELLQRLFDSENDAASAAFPDGTHCTAHADTASSLVPQCPRAEAKLARSTGFFTEDDPDSFVPVALVNRFDLTPSNLSSCGEYRIVYAKKSGFTDPTNRLFLIFEAALESGSTSFAACRPVAELWAGLETALPSDRAVMLEGFFFGTTAGGQGPVIQASHFGDQRGPCSYAGACGQIRVGQGMQEPWEFRQFRTQWLSNEPLRFAPVSLTSSVQPELFEVPAGDFFRQTYLEQGQLSNLGGAVLPRILLRDSGQYESTVSDVSGPAAPDYAGRLNRTDPEGKYLSTITTALASRQPPACSSDPLTAGDVIQRVTALSCAGCHSPETLLASGRSVGCGEVWPKSLGQTHISERGELSEALTEVFLPYRAGVFQTYLQACDAQAITSNLMPSPSLNIRVECFIAGTPVTMADGSTKPIEKVETGDLVLSFDETTHALVPARVQRTVVRRAADHLVSVNGELIATDNHPFRTARGWVRAEALRVGDTLVRVLDTGAGSAARFGTEPDEVRSLAMQPGTVDTYNLDVAETHGYFAGGFLVHDRP